VILSQTARYALQAMVYLTGEGSHAPVRVDQIAEDLQVPRNYLSKILHTLARTGLLNSHRGPNGGFFLARVADDITLQEVVEQFDTMEPSKICLLGRAVCGGEDPCAAHEPWGAVKDRVADFLGTTTIQDLSVPSDGS
jgi:Rrf2 family transcriptional regulator, iron-sulfur cluster assembly transcription factor